MPRDDTEDKEISQVTWDYSQFVIPIPSSRERNLFYFIEKNKKPPESGGFDGIIQPS